MVRFSRSALGRLVRSLLIDPHLGFSLVLIAALPSRYGTTPSSAHTADLLSQSLKLRLPSTKQVAYLPQVLHGFLLLKLFSRVFLHLSPRWRRNLVACTDDCTVEGYDTLA